jgi:altronate dehydratase small subunit
MPAAKPDPIRRVLLVDTKDNVATALCDLAAGDEVAVEAASGRLVVALRTAVPFGHKVALQAIARDAAVVKYGETIGRATRPIAAGEHVHIHNVASLRAKR